MGQQLPSRQAGTREIGNLRPLLPLHICVLILPAASPRAWMLGSSDLGLAVFCNHWAYFMVVGVAEQIITNLSVNGPQAPRCRHKNSCQDFCEV